MNRLGKRIVYRAFCIIALLASLYIITDMTLHGGMNFKIVLIFCLSVGATVVGIIEWKFNQDAVEKLENEISTYKHYMQPLEELSKEIRAKQHEFDNHLNAIVNLHVTVDNYDELVRRQSEYAEEIQNDCGRQLLMLLKISDKVLAGFLYSKLVGINPDTRVDLNVLNFEIISSVSEHQLIEIIGTLVDNAVEASVGDCRHIIIDLDSEEDRVIFEIRNMVNGITLGQVSRFFERGYSTKKSSGRGLGLYNARKIVKKHGGDITVSLEKINNQDYVCFRVEI